MEAAVLPAVSEESADHHQAAAPAEAEDPEVPVHPGATDQDQQEAIVHPEATGLPADIDRQADTDRGHRYQQEAAIQAEAAALPSW